jgi:hypothetical protein
MQGDRVAWPPWLADSPVPPKGRTTCPQSPFQGGRQRSAATKQGDQALRCGVIVFAGLTHPPGSQTRPSPLKGGLPVLSPPLKGDGRGAQRRCRGIGRCGVFVFAGSRAPLARSARPSPLKGGLPVLSPPLKGDGRGAQRRCRGISWRCLLARGLTRHRLLRCTLHDRTCTAQPRRRYPCDTWVGRSHRRLRPGTYTVQKRRSCDGSPFDTKSTKPSWRSETGADRS